MTCSKMVLWISWILLAHLVHLQTAQDYRHISYDDLKANSTVFQDQDVTHYSQLLFDVARQQVVVGARDNLYRLKLSSLTKLEHAEWPAPADKSTVCQDKGQSAENCRNYIKVLLTNGTNLFTCGTNAFSPSCTTREIEQINSVIKTESGITICPHSPHANVTALLGRSPSKGLFSGTPTDFSGLDIGIFRKLFSPTKLHGLKTPQYDAKWLNDPQFVSSFETDQHVYFLFRETAVEYINCGKKVYSRIARVCKNDPGGAPFKKESWTTFSKARLNCSVPGEFPFYYDEIQGAVYQPDEGIVYATFTTPSNAIAGSAICAFNMTSIEESFEGDYKYQENFGKTWERVKVPKDRRQQCDGSLLDRKTNVTERKYYEVMEFVKYQLMDRAVRSTTLGPLRTSVLERFSHIAVDVITTKRRQKITILYVATAEGVIKKITVLPRSQEACLIEIWGPLPSPIQTIQFLKDTRSLYVGMTSALLRIPASRCHRHKGRAACLNAQDPYCGWDELLQRCTQGPNQNDSALQWQQNVLTCPTLNDPVNGGWSMWSAWHVCLHTSTVRTYSRFPQHSQGHDTAEEQGEEKMDKCLCSSRVCNNPTPQHGGSKCVGASVKVTNCTVHGGWTAWSAWSTCSNTCGLAMRTRKRTCTNPAPAYGGRVCLGYDYDETMCIDLPPCPTESKQTELSQSGQWSPWSSWGDCSRICNGGHRIRKRTCINPLTKDEGLNCPGCSFQIDECNTHSCPETRKYSSWTGWMAVNASQVGSSSGYTEKRFRFNCRAQTDDSSSLKIQTKEEERYCRSSGSCVRGASTTTSNVDNSIDAGWSEWSPWSVCTKTCDGGSQSRIRTCEARSCEGPSIETRLCNMNPCSYKRNEWSCWTDWSPCSVSCGVGVHSRTRECLGGNCSGSNHMQESCEMPSCESLFGWDSWSRWSACDNTNQQQRSRKCLHPDVCLGHNRESRECYPEYLDNEIVNALPRSDEVVRISVGAVIGSCIIGFIIGLALTAVLCFYYIKHQSKPRIPSNPHYITKQNSYVTVPMKEVTTKRQPSFSGITNGNGTAKRQPSFSGITNGNGTLRKSNGIGGTASPKLYPKSLEYESTTLKRNSHGQAHIRAELEQEKYY